VLNAFPAFSPAEQVHGLLKYLQAGVVTFRATVAVSHHIALDGSHHWRRPYFCAMLSVKHGKLMALELRAYFMGTVTYLGTIKVFDFEINQHGARVVAVKDPLTAGCLSDGEIDTNIRLLKEDLDAVAARMKLAVRKQRNEPLRLG
jgi:hypothetical protein